MSRRVLVRAGACGAVLGGLVIALTAAMYLVATLFATEDGSPPSLPPGGDILIYFGFLLVYWVAPVALLVGVLGLYQLVGDGSSAARWGLVLCIAAPLVFVAGSALPYFYFSTEVSAPYDGPDNIGVFLFLQSALYVLQAVLLACGLMLIYVTAGRNGMLGTWRPLLPMIACVAILSAALPLAATEIGSELDTFFSQSLSLSYGLLWTAIGVALRRRAPNSSSRGGHAVLANL